MATGYAAYNVTATHATDNKAKILVKLLEGAAHFTRFALMGMQKNNPRIKGENISKVLAIITELNCALDPDIKGDLVTNLSTLYQYIMTRLTEANLNNLPEALKEVEHILIELKYGFEKAFIGQKSGIDDFKKVINEPGKLSAKY
ncbi:Flagellar secretion chaperone FliS [Candidatus Magnetomoraceae bacterium gMMP-1]